MSDHLFIIMEKNVRKKNKKKPDNTYSRAYALPSAPHRFTSKFEMELGGTSGLLLSGNCVCETIIRIYFEVYSSRSSN